MPVQNQQPRTTGYRAQQPVPLQNVTPVSGSSASRAGGHSGTGGSQPTEPGDPDAIDYKSAVRQLQEKVQQQNDTISDLLKENTAFHAQKGAKRRGQAGSAVGDVIDGVDDDLAIVGKLGRWWNLFMSPTIDPSAFFELEPPLKWDDPAMFASAENSSHSMAAELLASIPPSVLAKIREEKHLLKQFRKQLSDGRSFLLFKLRANAGELLGLKQEYFKLDKSGEATVKKSTIPEIRELLGITTNAKGKDVYTNRPPVLFLNGNTSIANMFLNPVLINAAILSVHSPEVLFNKNKSTSHPQSPYVRQKDWKNRVTPGLIAWICIMIIYILSDDTKFTMACVGNATDIDYLAYHTYYKGIITKAMDTPHFRKLMQTWNRKVFPKFTNDADDEVIDIDDSQDSTHDAQNQLDNNLRGIDGLLEGLYDLDLGDDQGAGSEAQRASPAQVPEGEPNPNDEDSGGSSEDEAEGVQAQLASGSQRRHASGLRPQASIDFSVLNDLDKTEESIEPEAIERAMSIRMNSTSGPPVRTYSFYTSTPAALTSKRNSAVGARMAEGGLPVDLPEDRPSPPSFLHRPPQLNVPQLSGFP
ncbi:hypothetical protein CPC08DRAFT_771334 [Agrocybe pediades]|nr:hypothetical protein CPC08DRAFT_771334 [Agrocybe pediades]